MTFNPSADYDKTETIVAKHSVGNLHHGAGPSLVWINPLREQWQIEPTNLFLDRDVCLVPGHSGTAPMRAFRGRGMPSSPSDKTIA